MTDPKEALELIKSIYENHPDAGTDDMPHIAHLLYSQACQALSSIPEPESTTPREKATERDYTPEIKHLVEVLENAETSYWWCDRCGEWVHGQQVSFEETHDREGCGEPVKTFDMLADELVKLLRAAHPTQRGSGTTK